MVYQLPGKRPLAGLVVLSLAACGEGPSPQRTARALAIRCPVEGQFTGPLELAPEVPNPSAGWDLWLEGMPQKIALSPPRSLEGSWLITCYYMVGGGGASVETNARIRGTRKCILVANGGVVTALKDGGQSCLIAGPPDASDDR